MLSFLVVFARQRESPGTDKGKDSAKKAMGKTEGTTQILKDEHRVKGKDERQNTNT
jgi:hypothetical protein